MQANEHEIRDFIKNFFAGGAISGIPINPALVTDDFDVLVDGRLDSLGFLELLVKLEVEFDCELDLSAAPELDVTKVSTLIKAAVS